MKLATWNINGTKARLPFVLRWLEHDKPDIVGLQELKTTEEKFPFDAFKEAGYHAVVHGQKAWNGVAILSKEPAEVMQLGLPGFDELGSRLITARVNGISFCTIYGPNGKTLEHEDFGRKLAWLDGLVAHMAEQFSPDDAVVLCGDFNVVPGALDTWNEPVTGARIFHTEAERNRVRKLTDWGFVDLFRKAEPEDPGFTWWDYRAGAFHKKQGLRIDLMLGTKSVAERLTQARSNRDWRKKVDGMIASDHAPVWVTLDVDADGADD